MTSATDSSSSGFKKTLCVYVCVCVHARINGEGHTQSRQM